MNMELKFRVNPHHLSSLLEKDEIPASSLKVLGIPLIIRNVNIVSNSLAIDVIKIPTQYANIINLVQDYFPSINVEEFIDDGHVNSTREHLTETAKEVYLKDVDQSQGVDLPINSLLRYFDKNGILVNSITYPWDYLNALQKVLQEEITHTVVSPRAFIAKSAIIEGPCVIEDNVTIGEFCKVRGPTYIGTKSVVGTSSLIRECMIESNTNIGFRCELGRSYFAGNDVIANLNVILDSVIGMNVSFGSFSRTTNVLLSKRAKNITYQINGGKTVDIGTHHFGSIIGNNCTIGASVVLLPARFVPANTVIEDETTYSKNIVVR